MIILLSPDIGPDERAAVARTLAEFGMGTEAVRLGTRHALVVQAGAEGVSGSPLSAEAVTRIAGVDRAIPLEPRAPLAAATRRGGSAGVSVGGALFGGGHVGVIAGPCAVEDRATLGVIAKHVAAAGAVCLRGGAFKVRTSPHSYQGGGLEALRELGVVAREVGLPFMTELTDPRQVEQVAGLVDGIQIGARHMQNFPLLVEAGRTGKPILLKRHMAADVDEWLLAAEYILDTGNTKVILCERGLKSGERHVRYLLDVGVVPYLKQRVGLPVVVDPSHAAGDWRLVPPLARAAVAAGADGLIVEVHCRPEASRSDAYQALPPADFTRLMAEVRALAAMDGRAVQPERPLVQSAVGM